MSDGWVGEGANRRITMVGAHHCRRLGGSRKGEGYMFCRTTDQPIAQCMRKCNHRCYLKLKYRLPPPLPMRLDSVAGVDNVKSEGLGNSSLTSRQRANQLIEYPSPAVACIAETFLNSSSKPRNQSSQGEVTLFDLKEECIFKSVSSIDCFRIGRGVSDLLR
jgi:hypothetical protein